MPPFVQDRLQTVFNYQELTIPAAIFPHLPQANMSPHSKLSLLILSLLVSFTKGANLRPKSNINGEVSSESIRDDELKQMVSDLEFSDHGDDPLKSNIVAYLDHIPRRARDDAYFASESSILVHSIRPPDVNDRLIYDDTVGSCNSHLEFSSKHRPWCRYPVHYFEKPYIPHILAKLVLFKGLQKHLRRLFIIWKLIRIVNKLRFKRHKVLKTFTKHLKILIITHRIRINRPIIIAPFKPLHR